jgi:hypothetical protein
MSVVQNMPANLGVCHATSPCPCCGDALTSATERGTLLVAECTPCREAEEERQREGNRPYPKRVPVYDLHFRGPCKPCACVYVDEYTLIRCDTCVSRRCTMCGGTCESRCTYDASRGLAQPNCASALCDKCIFKREWVGASPRNKLCFYGVAKLRLLAKRKLKGHWKLDREGLITALGPLVRDSDFPITA